MAETPLADPQPNRLKPGEDGKHVTFCRLCEAQCGLVATVIAEVTPDVVAGSVCYPHGWGHNGSWSLANSQAGANINVLASSDPSDWEQVSGACHLHGIPVRVSRSR